MPEQKSDSAIAEQAMRFVTPQGLRLFKQTLPDRAQLYRTNEVLEEGEVVDLDKDVMVMYYDHRGKIAIKVERPDGPYYLLVEEIDDGLKELCFRMADSARRVMTNEGRSKRMAQSEMQELNRQIVLGIRKHCRGNLTVV